MSQDTDPTSITFSDDLPTPSNLPTPSTPSIQFSTNTSPKKSPKKVSLELDPYATPALYYGKSHASRKVAKSRTLPAVCLHPRLSEDCYSWL